MLSYMQLPKRKPGKYAHIEQDPVMTKQKFDELTEKLRRLKRARPKAAAEVARLAELGDFSENVEYQMAKGRLRGINNRILKLEYQLDHAAIIEPNILADAVEVGHTVTLDVDGVKKIYRILGSTESNPAKGVISRISPLGSQLLGRRVGDSFPLVVGKEEKIYTILGIA